MRWLATTGADKYHIKAQGACVPPTTATEVRPGCGRNAPLLTYRYCVVEIGGGNRCPRLYFYEHQSVPALTYNIDLSTAGPEVELANPIAVLRQIVSCTLFSPAATGGGEVLSVRSDA